MDDRRIGPGVTKFNCIFPFYFANDSNDQDPPRWPILHGGGKITAGSTCSVLLRRNYFPNSICSKFEGAAAGVFHESFSKRETHFPMTVVNKVQSENALDRCRFVER